MTSKRELISRGAVRCGITPLLESMPRRPGLLVLNYHRVGTPIVPGQDTAVFSATADQFETQVAMLSKNFRIITLAETVRLAEDPSRLDGFCILLTFDDGYRDNYEIAYPILKAYGVPATFFLATSYVGTSTWPWWDRIAYLVSHNRKGNIHVSSGGGTTIVAEGRTLNEIVKEAICVYKRKDLRTPEAYVSDIAEACGVSLDEIPDQPVFLDWEQAAQLVAGGMDIGSHTHSHSILSKLSPSEQEEELRTSKALLAERLGINVETVSYPVGGLSTFTEDTRRALLRNGYRAAFSYYGGINLPSQIDRFAIRREGVELHDSMPLLRLRAALAASVSISMNASLQ